MSLATRCTACHTAFRVVQDQLKVSEGWVRCGRCDAVFNALEGLFDLEPAPAAPQDGTAAPQVPAAEPIADDGAAFTSEWLDVPPAARSDPARPGSAPAAAPWAREAHAPTLHDATPASRVDEEDRIDFADARFNMELLAEAGIPTGEIDLDSVPPSGDGSFGDVPAAVPAPEPAPALAAREPAVDPPAPEFLRQAERRARWSSPGARIALTLASLALLSLLAAQAALHYRDLVVTLFPDTRPAVQALCDLTGCRVEALRRIDDIVIESSALNALPGSDAVRLSVVLRNRGVFPLALPAIDLTLTDGGGQMIARRILTPADFGAAPTATLPAASEAPLQLVLTTSGRRASGYTVEPFYP
jgi:predicted Zn finger-like uncharacterized protein